MSIQVVKPLREFVDVSLSFSPHPLTGDITLLRDYRAINASLKNCIMIMVGEKPFHSDFGSQVSSSLFDYCDDITANEIAEEIKRTIQYNEPRVDVEDVFCEARPQDNEFKVEVQYSLKGYEEIQIFTHLLTPTR